jgi:hypothetical protein
MILCESKPVTNRKMVATTDMKRPQALANCLGMPGLNLGATRRNEAILAICARGDGPGPHTNLARLSSARPRII